MEEAQTGIVAGVEHCAEIGLVVAGGVGTGAVVVEAPHAAVGQDSPPDFPIGRVIGRREIAQDLAVGTGRLDLVVRVARVEGKTEPLALLNDAACR